MTLFERERPPYTISTDQKRLDLDAVHAFLAHESYWARGIARNALAHLAHDFACGSKVLDDLLCGFPPVARETTQN